MADSSWEVVGLFSPVRSPSLLRPRSLDAPGGRAASYLPAAVGLYGALYLAWNLASSVSPEVRYVMGNLSSVPVGLVGCILTLRVARHASMTSTFRLGWRLLAVAVGFGALGNIFWALAPSAQVAVSLTAVAHVAFVLSYVTAATAALRLIDPPPTSRERVKLSLDAAMVMLGGGMLIWHGVVVPQLMDADGTAARALAMVYPACDLFLATCGAALLLRCPDNERRRPVLLMVASFTVVIARDLLTGIPRITDPLTLSLVRECCTLTFFVLLTMAIQAEYVRLEGADSPVNLPPLHTTLIPYGAVISGYALLLIVAWGGADEHTFQLLVGSLLLTVLVAVRQIVAVRENLLLHRERDLLSGEA